MNGDGTKTHWRHRPLADAAGAFFAGDEGHVADTLDEVPPEEIDAAEGMFANAGPADVEGDAAPVKAPPRPSGWSPRVPKQTFTDAPEMSPANTAAIFILAEMVEGEPTLDLAREFVACLIPDETDEEFLAEVSASVVTTLRERAAKSEAERNRPTAATVAPDAIEDVWNHDWSRYNLPEVCAALPANFSRQERAAVLLMTGRATTLEIMTLVACSPSTVAQARNLLRRKHELGEVVGELPATVVSAAQLGRMRSLDRPSRKGRPSPNRGRSMRGGPGNRAKKLKKEREEYDDR